MRGVLLWLIGIPIPIIILLYLFNVLDLLATKGAALGPPAASAFGRGVTHNQQAGGGLCAKFSFG